MPIIDDYLREMLSLKGSDLHLSINYPAKYRISGNLRPANDFILTPEFMEKMLRENSEKADGRLYASGPALTLENGRRGRLIYPTMHAVMGLCALRNAARRMAGGAAGASDAGREETAWKNL